MEAFAGYLLKSSVWLSGFALVYLIFLRNERFFLIKRFFLLAGILTALLFPFISITYMVELPVPETGHVMTAAPEVAYYPAVSEGETAGSFDFMKLLLYLYLAGAAILIIRFLWQTGSLLQILGKAEVNERHRVKVVRAGGLSSSFSFFHYVFIGSEVSDRELDEIMNHELVHVDQRHWFDLILAELLRALQWVNPFAWIYSRLIRQNHEYLADESALQKTSDPSVYRAVLANQILGLPVFSISNSFSFSINKKRFDMMNRIITSPYRKLKVLFILPVFAVVFYAFAEADYSYAAQPADPLNTAIPAVTDPGINNSPESDELPAVSRETVDDGVADQKPATEVVRTQDVPAAQRPLPLVVIDGVISEKPYPDAIRDLGYDLGPVRLVPQDEAKEKYGDKAANGVYEVTTRKKALEMGISAPLPRLAPGDYPTFQGRSHLFFNDWVSGQVIYPEAAKERKVEGWVTANLSVELDGTISNLTYVPGTDPLLGEEVLRVIRTASLWGKPENPEVDSPFAFSVTIGFRIPDQIIKDPPFVVVEQMPLYPGGEVELLNFLRDNLIYPEAAKVQKLEGRVIVRFIVDTDGNAVSPAVLKGVHPLLDAEALKVVSKMTGFKPGMQGGKPVNVWYMVPITFSLQ